MSPSCHNSIQRSKVLLITDIFWDGGLCRHTVHKRLRVLRIRFRSNCQKTAKMSIAVLLAVHSSNNIVLSFHCMTMLYMSDIVKKHECAVGFDSG
ncbi:hypothetical protein GJ496_004984 [Pomphorhynchus laevis]|nr:hypothetical protein GJ496_004984 [Pomphorhynchus laevis]